jgi:hypothetical protein
MNYSRWQEVQVGVNVPAQMLMLKQPDSDECGCLAWGYWESCDTIKSHPRKARYFHTPVFLTLPSGNHWRTGSGWFGRAGPRDSNLGTGNDSEHHHVHCMETFCGLKTHTSHLKKASGSTKLWPLESQSTSKVLFSAIEIQKLSLYLLDSIVGACKFNWQKTE